MVQTRAAGPRTLFLHISLCRRLFVLSYFVLIRLTAVLVPPNAPSVGKKKNKNKNKNGRKSEVTAPQALVISATADDDDDGDGEDYSFLSHGQAPDDPYLPQESDDIGDLSESEGM